MKKIHKLIVFSYLGPFILTFFITLFIFVMQFLWKYIDDLVGKGLEWYLVAELLFYASANLVPMALPLSILLASIMTFGSMGEHYELVAMKSSGMSLQRIMYPLFIVTLLTSMGAFFFSNSIWPKANLEFASLLYDIRHKKPAFDIVSGVYYEGIDNYVIKVEKKMPDGQGLEGITIYDHSDNSSNKKVIRAETGRMAMSENQDYLLFSLFDGYSYEEIDETGRPHTMNHFEEQIIRFDLSGFNMERSDKDIFRDNYQMLNLGQLESAIDTLEAALDENREEYERILHNRTFRAKDDSAMAVILSGPVDSVLLEKYRHHIEVKKADLIKATMSQIRSNKSFVTTKNDVFRSNLKSISKHFVEWHRKFTLSIACIVLFFIGAPLGAIIRKGGLGMPVVVSVLFFLIYHISSMIGEKMVKSGELPAYEGMWLSTVILIPIGIFLTYKAATDSRIMEADTYKKAVEKITLAFKGKLSKKPAIS